MAGNPALIVRVAATIDELKKNLAEGVSQIETTTAAMGKLAASFSGDKLIQQAQNVVAAVNQIGGASKLTEAEQARVNATLDRALEKYAVLGREAPPGMQALADATRKVQPPTQDVTVATESWAASIAKTATGYLTGMVTWQTASRVISELTGFVLESIAANAEAEVIQTKLEAALRNTHQPIEQTSQLYQQYAASLQATTTLEDDAVLSVMALATEMGVTADQMLRVITVSADLSAAWGISLEEAMSTVVKGGEGMTRAFTAHAIELDTSRVKAEGLAYVLPELEQHFSGNAAAQLETYTGRVTALGVAWGNLKESLGGLATAGGVVNGAIEKTSLVVLGLSTVIQEQGVKGLLALSASGSDMLPVLLQVGQRAQEAATHIKRTGDISLDTAKNTADLSEWIGILRKSVESLTPQQKTWIDQALALGASEAEIAKHLKVSEEGVKSYVDAQKKRAVEVKAAIDDETKAQIAYADLEDHLHREFLKHWEEEETAKKKQTATINKTVVDGLQEILKLRAEVHDAENKMSMDSATYQINKIWERADAEIRAFKGTGQQAQEHADLVYTIASYEAKGITDVMDVALDTMYGKAVFTINKVADDVTARVNVALQQYSMVGGRHLTQAELDEYYQTAAGIQEIIRNGGKRYYEGEILPRATGGDVTANRTYMVGERGPELFVPERSGTIVPSGSSGAGTTIVNHIYITQPLGTPDAIGEAIVDRIRRVGMRFT